jgi:hypothetical protein
MNKTWLSAGAFDGAIMEFSQESGVVCLKTSPDQIM